MPQGQNSGGPKHINTGTFTASDDRARRAGQQADKSIKAENGRAGGLKRALVRTEATAAAARANGQAGGRPRKTAAETACTCKAGDGAAPELHAKSCRKRKAYLSEK